MNFLKEIIKRWRGYKYINVGEIVDNKYLAWPKPRKKDKYVAINTTTGNIDWEYKFDDNNFEWFKLNSDGVECEMVTSLRKTPLEYSVSCTIKGIEEEDEGEWQNYPTITSNDEDNVYETSTDKFIQYTLENGEIIIGIELPDGYVIESWKKNENSLETTEDTITDIITEDATYTLTIKKKVEE